MEQFTGSTLRLKSHYWRTRDRSPFLSLCSDPDDWGCGCEGHSGPGVVIQVDHGVVGGALAAKGSASAHLPVSQTLQVALPAVASWRPSLESALVGLSSVSD